MQSRTGDPTHLGQAPCNKHTGHCKPVPTSQRHGDADLAAEAREHAGLSTRSTSTHRLPGDGIHSGSGHEPPSIPHVNTSPPDEQCEALVFPQHHTAPTHDGVGRGQEEGRRLEHKRTAFARKCTVRTEQCGVQAARGGTGGQLSHMHTHKHTHTDTSLRSGIERRKHRARSQSEINETGTHHAHTTHKHSPPAKEEMAAAGYGSPYEVEVSWENPVSALGCGCH